MTTRAVRTLVASTMVAVTGLALGAATPVFWNTSTRADFVKGEAANLSVDSEGRLLLGPAMPLVHESTAPFLWSAIAAADGTLFVGSGNDGKVFRLAPDGAVTVFFDAPELQAHALVAAPDGALYVGTSPDGRIYRLDTSGTATVVFDPEDKYIWALAVDRTGNLYAGTGEKGTIYRITPDGKGAVFYNTRATHVLALAFDAAGNLLAGTEAPGRVFRLDPSGRPFVLLDTAFREVRALRVAPDGSVYAAAVGGRGSESDRPAPAAAESDRPGQVPLVSAEITSVSIVDAALPQASSVRPPSRDPRRSAAGAVYRLSPDGTSETIWDSPDDLPYDLALNGNGEALVGTGPKGRIYRVAAGDPPRVTLLGRVGAQQVTRLLAGRQGENLILTANPGKVFRLSSARAAEGTFESDVRDAGTVSTWGTIRWRATVPDGSFIQVRSRSGNSTKPDDTWSPWSDPYTNADGQPVTSPKARFLQWKATFTGRGATPVLTSVSVAYLQRNLRPRIESITVLPAGTVFQRPFSTGELEIAGFDQALEARPPAAARQAATGQAAPASPPLGRRTYQKGLQTFMWRAEDENDDDLRYDVFYRREGESDWNALKRDLGDAILVWDTTAVPNGTYVVRVTASDSPSNPPGLALTGELTSATFDVDNTPPVIHVVGVRPERAGHVVSVEVRDDQSVVERVEYSVDAERWTPVYPVDGIADSKVERFEIYFEGETLPASIVLRATDAMHNVSTGGATAVGQSDRPPAGGGKAD